MTEGEVWTVGRLLQWTTDYLKRHGAESARLDAEVLLAEAMGCQRIDLYVAFGNEPPEPARTAFRELVKRRAEGSPVAYLVHRREFFSLSFHVTPDVLIPRPETELLVVKLVEEAKRLASDRPALICDVGTGSGAIAICAAKQLPQSRVSAIDISPAALRIAQLNAAEHGVADRIDFFEGDLLAAIPDTRTFDVIASNPPYVSESEFAKLPRDVRDFEPRTALVAGPRGTEAVERLLAQAADRINAGGNLLIEISPMIHDAVLALAAADARWSVEPTIKDLARLPRVVHFRRT
jgi:release factor glutamine methyltransferase